MAFRLAEYDPLAKRRAILRDGVPVAWVDYDDVSREEADGVAEKMLEGLNAGREREIVVHLNITPGAHDARSAEEIGERLRQLIEQGIGPNDDPDCALGICVALAEEV